MLTAIPQDPTARSPVLSPRGPPAEPINANSTQANAVATQATASAVKPSTSAVLLCLCLRIAVLQSISGLPNPWPTTTRAAPVRFPAIKSFNLDVDTDKSSVTQLYLSCDRVSPAAVSSFRLETVFVNGALYDWEFSANSVTSCRTCDCGDLRLRDWNSVTV
jgi:hypothetical protein